MFKNLKKYFVFFLPQVSTLISVALPSGVDIHAVLYLCYSNFYDDIKILCKVTYSFLSMYHYFVQILFYLCKYKYYYQFYSQYLQYTHSMCLLIITHAQTYL